MDINATSKKAAKLVLEGKLVDELDSKPEPEQGKQKEQEHLEVVDSWWDYGSIEIEEHLFPEENSLRRGIELDFDKEV